MALGLRRGTVRLVDHDPQWFRDFALEREDLQGALGERAIAIEHIGSTAVEQLKSKPVMDIAIAARSGEVIALWGQLLESLGYEYFGDREGRGDCFFAKGPDASRTIYLHVAPERSDTWVSYLKFRDRLRHDPSVRTEYEALKESLAAQFPEDRAAYTEAKAAFINKVVQEANKAVDPTPGSAP